MAFKQPRVPEYREREGADRYIRSLVLFLKDFCMDVWTANNQRTGEIGAVREGYPVTSVCGKTGDVALTAGDVGARPGDWTPTASDVGALAVGGTAVNAGKLDGKTWAQALDAIYPVGAVYISTTSTSPASLFGGTWTQITGRYLIGTDAPELNDDGTSPGDYSCAAGRKGGEAKHTLSIGEIPSHAGHLYGNAGGVNGKGNAKGAWLKEININSALTTSYGWNYKNNEYYPVNRSLGGGAAHNNMPPYLAVYMWKRVS